MTERNQLIRGGCGVVLAVFVVASFLSTPGTAVALDLNPFDYYDVDYHIVFSDDEVKPGEEFSITIGAEVRCIKDMPFGVDEATVVVSGIARHTSSAEELVLLDEFEVAIPDVPDWQGDVYAMEETVDLAFPENAAAGTYDIVARLEHVSIDGWNITGLVPSGYRSFPVGSIMVTPEEITPPPPPPVPAVTPGQLSINIMGHEYSPEIDDDGVILEDVSAMLIEGEVSAVLRKGTRCLDDAGDPLTYISLARRSSPPPYADGVVLAAYSLYPDGATFSPPLSLAVKYNESELPQGVTPDDLALAFYDNGAWQAVSSNVNGDERTVEADIRHFSTIGLLATASTPSPAEFVVEGLSVSPATVSPMASVLVAFTVRNTGGTSGSYPLMVEVNGRSEYAKELNLAPRSSQHIRFRLARSTPGTYTVSVGDGPSASFTVQADSSATGVNAPQAPIQPTEHAADDGMHPLLIALLVMAGVAFLTIVILLLAGVL